MPTVQIAHNPRARLKKDLHATIQDAASIPDIKKGGTNDKRQFSKIRS